MRQHSVAIAALLATGCSFVGVRGLPSPIPKTYEGGCTESHTLPAIDAVVASGVVVVAIMVLATWNVPPDSDLPDFRPGFGVLAGVVALPYGLSALAGFDEVGRCVEAKHLDGRLWDQRRESNNAARQRADAARAASATRERISRDQQARDAQEDRDSKAAFEARVSRDPCLKERGEQLRAAAAIADVRMRARALQNLPACEAPGAWSQPSDPARAARASCLKERAERLRDAAKIATVRLRVQALQRIPLCGDPTAAPEPPPNEPNGFDALDRVEEQNRLKKEAIVPASPSAPAALEPQHAPRLPPPIAPVQP